jgi:hypothetical protein
MVAHGETTPFFPQAAGYRGVAWGWVLECLDGNAGASSGTGRQSIFVSEIFQ